jgi:hypothetical protein
MGYALLTRSPSRAWEFLLVVLGEILEMGRDSLGTQTKDWSLATKARYREIGPRGDGGLWLN